MRPGAKASWLISGLLLSVIALSAPPESKGRPVLDQFNVGPADSGLNGGSDWADWQQGVTAGISGQLTRIDISFQSGPYDNYPTYPSTLYVKLGPPWQISAPVWSVEVFPVVGWNTFDLSKKKIFLQAGDEFVIGIHGSNPNNHFAPGIDFSYGDLYPGGDLYLNGSLNSEVNDIMFRTYVKQSAGKGN